VGKQARQGTSKNKKLSFITHFNDLIFGNSKNVLTFAA
jgi:hypothetical protein